MKRSHLNICIMAILMVVITSCQDYLDIPSKSKFDSESIVQDINRTEMSVLGCYASTFNREFFYQLGMGTDECFSVEGETNSKNQIANYVYTPSNTPTGLYNTMYQGIEYANVCIKNLESMKSSDARKQKKINHLLGEVLAIRAENYLNLVRFFGDVPFVTVSTADASSFYSSRTPRDTIYDHIIADMQRATTLLSWRSEHVVESETERFTKNAAYGMLARIALYAAGYSLRWDLDTYDPATVRMAKRDDEVRIKQLYKIAANACKAVIDQGENKLLPKYETVFRNILKKKFDDENMLLIGQYSSQVKSFNIGYTNGIFCHTNTIYMKAAPQMIANPVYYFDFTEGDSRRDVAICNYGYAGTKDKTGERRLNGLPSNTIGKFRVDWKNDVGVKANVREIDFPILRYSDVLLMYAEALNELNIGADNEAVNALKQVRLRAFNGNGSLIGDIPTDHDGFLKAIQQERKLELGFEGWRRTDLCRWNILFETLTETKSELAKLAQGEGRFKKFFRQHYGAYKVERPEGFNEKIIAMKWIPITQADSASYAANGYIVQNMLWGTNGFTNGSHKLDGIEPWMTTSLFRGLTKNQVEILPLNTSAIMDINKGLIGQQHPLY